MPLLMLLNMNAPRVHAFELSFCYIVEPLEGGALLEEMSQAPRLVYLYFLTVDTMWPF